MTIRLPASRLVRQVLGAALGGILALSCYGIYTLAAPPLRAMLFGDEVVSGEKHEYDEIDREATQDEVIQRAQVILQRLTRGEENR